MNDGQGKTCECHDRERRSKSTCQEKSGFAGFMLSIGATFVGEGKRDKRQLPGAQGKDNDINLFSRCRAYSEDNHEET